jgi:hypothetical protein
VVRGKRGGVWGAGVPKMGTKGRCGSCRWGGRCARVRA